MYKAFYGFQEKPFTLTPDPAFLYLSKQHEMALTMLNYGLQSDAGISVISGEVGAGKTTLIREILQNLGDDSEVGLISNAHSAFGDLLQWVLMAFNITTEAKDKAGRYQVLMDFLISNYANNKKTILIIDEAQNMDAETLEELRLISNINADKHLVLQLVLVGQPELLAIMQRHELRQLAQRVSVDYKLKALGYKETVAYIKHRLVVAGGDKNIIDKYAIAAIFYYSGGIPRLINTLCDFALVFGFSEELEQINLDIMMDVIKGKQDGGVFPMIQQENKEQKRVRELVQQQLGIDIGLLMNDENESEIDDL
ncbi:MAG: AAA family ATPase [Methylococcaceae bacterium]|nr:AAA family ATPase [Methylococcaceae bacterium]